MPISQNKISVANTIGAHLEMEKKLTEEFNRRTLGIIASLSSSAKGIFNKMIVTVEQIRGFISKFPVLFWSIDLILVAKSLTAIRKEAAESGLIGTKYAVAGRKPDWPVLIMKGLTMFCGAIGLLGVPGADLFKLYAISLRCTEELYTIFKNDLRLEVSNLSYHQPRYNGLRGGSNGGEFMFIPSKLAMRIASIPFVGLTALQVALFVACISMPRSI